MAAPHLTASQIHAFLNGQLSRAALERIEDHLETCGACRDRLRAERRRRSASQDLDVTPLISFTLNLLRGWGTMISRALAALPTGPIGPREEAAIPEVAFEPLRVLQPRVQRGAQAALRFIGRFGIVLGLTVLVLLFPTPSGLSQAGHRALAVFVFTGSILALEPVSLPIAALMVPMAQVVLSVADTTEAFRTFSRPVVFLILSSLFLAEALRKHGLTRRLALSTIVASGGGINALLLGLMGIAALLSMWVENTATAAVLIPVALTISRQIPDPKQARPVLVLLVLGIGYSASVGGMSTVMGAASNAVASGFLAQLQPWTFVDWMVYGVPAFLLVFPLTWWLLTRLVPVGIRDLDVEPAREEVKKLGPISAPEREILFTMAAAAFFWVSGSFIEPALGLPSTLLSSAMVAVAAVSYLAIRGIIDWEDIKGVSWGIFLIIGAGLSLGETLTRTGATDWFAEQISPLISGPPLVISMLLMVFLSALLTNVMNNTTIAAVFVPILISLGSADPSFNAVQLVLPVTLATTFGYSLPSASGRMALIAASGIVDRGEMMRYGILMTVASSVLLGLFFYVISLLNWI
jgi:sodium-dependent dicarboxylate transporter 2/3/5